MNLLAGIDLGTTALKGIIINEHGKIISTKTLSTKYEYPQKDYVEFSSEQFYKKICLLINELLVPIPSNSQIKGISLSGASGNTLLLDNKNKPLQNAISWLDKRPVDFSPISHISDHREIYEITGWPFLKIFPLAHLTWIKTQRPDLFRSASRFLLNITYVYYRLTGRFAMDFSTATTFYLQDQQMRKWHRPFINALNISISQLPELLPSARVIGNIRKLAAKETGLSGETKVVLGSFDHPAAARGTGVLKEGSLLLSCGTSWVGFYPVANRKTGLENNLLIDPFLSPEGPWGVMFSLPGIGKTIDILIDHLIKVEGQINKYNIFNRKANQSPQGADGVTLDLLKPVEVIIEEIQKIKLNTSVQNLLRAIMESTIYEIKRNLEHYEKNGLNADNITMVGGASESKLWTHLLADITNRPVSLLNGQMAGALGSTIMAGIGTGLFRNEREGFAKIGGKAEIILPDKLNSFKYEKFYTEYIKKYPHD